MYSNVLLPFIRAVARAKLCNSSCATVAIHHAVQMHSTFVIVEHFLSCISALFCREVHIHRFRPLHAHIGMYMSITPLPPPHYNEN